MPMLQPPIDAEAPDVHRAGQDTHPGRDRSRGRNRWHRCHPASRGRLLLVPHRMAQAAGRRSLRCTGARQARPEDCRTQPAGSQIGSGSARQCPSDAAPETRRSHHRASKKSCGAAGHPAGAERRRALTQAVVALAPDSRMTAAACAALGVSRASVQRRRARLTAAPAIRGPRPRPARALTASQQQIVLDLLHAPRFADQAPAEIYASLLDEGVYHCSIRTMYRVLRQNGEVRERRDQLRHPSYRKPELLAERPNQVWSLDITKLMGLTKWSYFYLYDILDIFSRRVVGWCVADAESATLFKPLFDDAISKHNVPPGQLTLP